MVVSIEKQGRNAVVRLNNPPVNALSQAMRQGLWQAVGDLDTDPAVDAVVLIADGPNFIAGADISEFSKPPLEPHLPDVIARIEDAAKPWLAAIHGAALGGGLEVALGCRWRIVATSAKLGFPEVTLGIVPGAGGTVRLPRLIPVADTVELVTTGQPVTASKARALGLVDAVVEVGMLLPAALEFLAEVMNRAQPAPLSRRAANAADAEFWRSQEAVIAKRARGEAAPLRALACVRKATEAGFSEALAFERTTFLELRQSDQAAALRHVFFAERAAPKPPEYEGVEPLPVRKTAVIGGGTMGAGIAAALRDAGLPVVLVERDEAALSRGVANLQGIFEGGVKRGKLTAEAAAARMAGVEPTTDYGRLADIDVVVEAVFEELGVKQAVFRALDDICHPNAVLATNTSYLDPNAIASATRRPQQVLGLHFFSPAHLMKLLEIVPTSNTSPKVVATAMALARNLRKIPVIAGVCDGFIGNRILKNNRPVLERLLLSGVQPAEIDAAMRGFGMAMGPFEVQDLSGLDIAAFQRQAAREQGEAVFAPIGDRLVEQKRLGRKTGGGWHDYDAGDPKPRPSPVVAEIIAEEAAKHSVEQFAGADLAEIVIFPMVDEAFRILAEGIARRPADIDLVEIHGYGFPRWRGGLMHYAGQRRLDVIANTLSAMSRAGLVAPPSASLLAAAEKI